MSAIDFEVYSCDNTNMKELSLKVNIIWNTVGSLLYQACQWLTTIFVVTLSSTYENSGILAFAMATGNVYSSLATYNVRPYQVSDVNHVFSSNNYVAFRFITVFAAMIICGTYSVLISPNFETILVVAVYLMFKADEAFVNVLYGIDQIANRMDYIGVSQSIRGVLSVSSFCLVLLLFDQLSYAVFSMFLTCFAVTLVYDIPHSRVLARIKPCITKEECLSLFIKCAPAVVSLTLYGATASIVRQWFGVAYGEELLGIYAAIATPCVLVQALASYLYTPLLVPIANYWSKKDKESILILFRKVAVGGIIVLAVCVIGALLFGGDILKAIYGSSIVEFTWIFAPALIAAFFMACSCFVADVLIAIRQLKFAVILNLIALIFSLCFMSIFVEMWSLNGINMILIGAFFLASIFGVVILMKELHSQQS